MKIKRPVTKQYIAALTGCFFLLSAVSCGSSNDVEADVAPIIVDVAKLDLLGNYLPDGMKEVEVVVDSLMKISANRIKGFYRDIKTLKSRLLNVLN